MKYIGRGIFWLTWPLQWLYLPLTRRVRVVIERDDPRIAGRTQVVLVQNFIGSGAWELPGGGIHFGESIEDAAIREVREELGLSIADIRVLNDAPLPRRVAGLLVRVHYVRAAASGTTDIKRQWELADAAWKDTAQVEQLAVYPRSLFPRT